MVVDEVMSVAAPALGRTAHRAAESLSVAPDGTDAAPAIVERNLETKIVEQPKLDKQTGRLPAAARL